MNKKGFTLIETLMVLAITTILFMLTAQAYNVRTEDYELRYFVREFLSEIEHAQNMAVVTGIGVIVERTVIDGQICYEFNQENNSRSQNEKKLVLPKGSSGTIFNAFWIKSDSGYIPPSTLNFWNKNINIRISFQFALGRFEVEETKR